jgi:UDP-N-acetylmuramoylalanine--D-glutamate ligase
VRELAGKRVIVLGLARQGVALVQFLAGQGARVTASDLKSEKELAKEMGELQGLAVEYRLGGHPLEMLEHVDLVCLSGGVPVDLPVVVEAQQKGIPLTNDTQLFLEATPARVIGITGSAGKTTTTTLVGRMAQAASAAGTIGRAWIGGNIGNPLLSDLADMRKGDLAVVELSSFQLELTMNSPQVAAILNITPNHLDRHHSMQAYAEAKARILAFQSAEDAAVLDWDSPATRDLAPRVKGRCNFFSLGPKEWQGEGAYREDGWIVLAQAGRATRIMPTSAVQLRGEHNLANVVAACAIAASAGLPEAVMKGAVEDFRGVAHRLEFVASRGGADWYNDSIATSPERAMAAIRSFREPIILLAGGRDKKLPWREWVRLVSERVDHLVLFGEAAEMIAQTLRETQPGERPYTTAHCTTLEQAVSEAARVAERGDVILLSPGGTSFDAFHDFEQRGERFRVLVMALDAEGKKA